MAGIKYADIESECNTLHKVANDIKETLENIEKKTLAISSNDMWVGKASDHFNEYVRNLSKNYDDIYNELEASVLYLASCAEGYKAVDQMIMNQILNNLNISDPSNYQSNVYR